LERLKKTFWPNVKLGVFQTALLASSLIQAAQIGVLRMA